jgi:hypothetical protein
LRRGRSRSAALSSSRRLGSFIDLPVNSGAKLLFRQLSFARPAVPESIDERE